MIFEQLKQHVKMEDEEFNSIYPENVRKHAQGHWTPLDVARIAAEYLVKKPSAKVLDIGSGAGKFCMIGSALTQGFFTGIEQRENLVQVSRKISKYYKLGNVEFIHANILEVPFTDFDSFYFYNAFHENLEAFRSIDYSITLNTKYYYLYSEYVKQELSKTPVGTRLVTYHSALKEVPSSFRLEATAYDDSLIFWQKSK